MSQPTDKELTLWLLQAERGDQVMAGTPSRRLIRIIPEFRRILDENDRLGQVAVNAQHDAVLQRILFKKLMEASEALLKKLNESETCDREDECIFRPLRDALKELKASRS